MTLKAVNEHADVAGAQTLAERQDERKHQTHMHGLHSVGVDDLLVRFTLLVGIRTLVDELHLLQNSGLSTLSCTKQQHLTVPAKKRALSRQ